MITCDRGGCNRPVYGKEYWNAYRHDGMRAVSMNDWDDLCFYHYTVSRIRNYIHRGRNWYIKVKE